MTLNKYSSLKQDRSYGQERSSRIEQFNSQTSSDSGKSSHAARMAQSLGSQHSWADTYAPQTPAGSAATPTASTASTVDADERDYLLRGQDRADDPPPSYDDSTSRSSERPGQHVADDRSIPSNVRSLQDQDEESESSSHDGRETPRTPEELEAAQSTTSHCRTRRKGCPKESIERRRRLRIACLFVAFVIVSVLMMGGQAFPALKEAILPPPAPLPTRSYTRHETSQSISGTFTFYDVLDLSTQSGSIRIVVDPQPGEKPAILRLSSSAGSIRVELSDKYVNSLREKGTTLRPWDTTIKSSSGSVKAWLPVGGGSNTVLQSQSGSITATLFASEIGPHDNVSTLITESTSGSQAVTVQPVIGTTLITNLIAKHHASGSASMRIGYPQAWQGVLHASVAGSATVKVQGDDLRFQHNGDRDVYAWRGQGQTVDVTGEGSGSIKVDCSSIS